MSEPVGLSELTFIPGSVRNRLRRHGFGTSADLLRITNTQLARRLGHPVTVVEVARWQNVCSELEIEGMTLAWARVLGLQANIPARDLGRRSLSRITALFAQALQNGDTADVPDADAIAAMMVDSARIDRGAVLNATVWDRSDRPLKSARVRCASLEATTDAQGRARLIRLPLGQPVEVTIEKAGYAQVTRTLARLEDLSVVDAHRFSMKRGRSVTRPPSKRVLSELDGDVVPVSRGQRVLLIEVKNRKLRKGDILYLFDRLQNGEAKLSSRFKELRNGELSVPVWRVPAASLPPGAEVGSDYGVTDDGLRPVEVTPERLARWRIARQVMAETKSSGSVKARLTKSLKEYIKRTRAIGALG